MENNIRKDEIECFTELIDGFFLLKPSEQIDYFVYFLTVEKEFKTIQATIVRECFLILDLLPYSNISQYLVNNCKSKGKASPKFLRIRDGYSLHRILKNHIESNLNEKPFKIKVNNDLRNLLSHINNSEENEFLKEALDCFEISAYRASVIMVWNLTIDHLYQFIMKHKLPDFNNILSKNTDKRIKITQIISRDDFGEIPENKFIEFCKSSTIVSNDVRKILDNKLGIRNTYAHPSNVKMIESKALEFIEDLINNVVLKYKI